MFAKQQSVLNKHQNELAPDRRPGPSAQTSSAASITPLQPSPATAPLYPTAQSTNTAAARPAAQTPPQQHEPATEPVTIGSRLIVGPDVKLKGAEILDCDTLVVEGRVEAVMDSRVIRIAENGSFSGKVGIDVAEIFGEFDGDLTARQQLIIHSTGRVSGKIRYGKLLVEEGGTLSGDVQSLSETPGDVQQRHNSSATSEKEANTQMKSHLSTVAL